MTQEQINVFKDVINLIEEIQKELKIDIGTPEFRFADLDNEGDQLSSELEIEWYTSKGFLEIVLKHRKENDKNDNSNFIGQFSKLICVFCELSKSREQIVGAENKKENLFLACKKMFE